MSRLIPAVAPSAIDEAAAALNRGEVIAIPTETVYGLAVLPRHDAVERLIAAKQRSADKGIQLLIDSLEQAAQLAQMSPAALRLGTALWPGGLTLVVERRTDVGLPLLLGGGRSTLGLRLPDHDVPRTLARRLGPLAASSANVSGEPDARTADVVVATLGDSVAVVIDDGRVRGGVPSTVVDCTLPDGSVRVLREGAIDAERIAALAGRD